MGKNVPVREFCAKALWLVCVQCLQCGAERSVAGALYPRGGWLSGLRGGHVLFFKCTGGHASVLDMPRF